MRFYVRSISYFRRDWHWVGLFLLMVAVSIGIGVMQAWPMAVLVDSVLSPTPLSGGWPHWLFLGALPKNRLAQVIGVTLIGMLMKVTQDALGAAKTMVNNTFTYNGRLRVRGELYRKLQDLHLGYHRSLPQGDAIYRVLNDTLGPDQILGTLLNSTVAGVTLAVMVTIMLSRNIPLTVFALSVTPLLLIANNYFGKRIKCNSIGVKQRDTTLTTLVQRAMSTVGLVQAFNRQDKEFDQFHTAAARSAKTTLKLDWDRALFSLVINTIYALGGAIIFGYGGYLVYRDQFLHPKVGGVTCGDLMVFMAYLGSLWDPLRTITSTRAEIQTGVAGAERVFAVLDESPTVVDRPEAEHFPLQRRELTLDSVCFGYRENQQVLRHVSASISSGQMVGFVGPSGAGKSTLLQLIPRFYDAVEGSVQLDGIDVRDIPVADLRRHIALVPQECLLLPATIAENIAYGRSDATFEQIIDAATMAGADDFISDLPDGYDTRLDEGGMNLSGGQRQRLSIARALLTDAPILVLDEPTSALDPEHARQVLNTLHSLRRHRTVILVTHHLASVAGCDQIYVLDAGRIVEQGTHLELLRNDGLYVDLLRADSHLVESPTLFQDAA